MNRKAHKSHDHQESKRWRLRLSLRTLLLLFTLATVALFASPRVDRWITMLRLASYDSTDLREMDASEDGTVRRLLSTVISQEAAQEDILGGQFTSWYIWRTRTASSYLMVFQVQEDFFHPSAPRARAYFLDFHGRIVAQQEFDIGYRVHAVDASFHEGEYAFPCVIIEFIKPLNENEIRWQYYGLYRNRLELVRVEDSTHKLIPVSQALTSIADPQYVWTDEWHEGLSSSSDVRILNALCTLPVDEDVLMSHKSVRKRLATLSRSSEPWIAEGASTYLSVLNKLSIARKGDMENLGSRRE